jgi:hypothetical protein
MNIKIPEYDINLEPFMTRPPDFNNKSVLMQTEKGFKSEVINIVKLTAQEKLFQIRILDSYERKKFAFLPGQFVMLELPGCGEVPISISSSGPLAHTSLCKG